jgi:hypothetical protein
MHIPRHSLQSGKNRVVTVGCWIWLSADRIGNMDSVAIDRQLTHGGGYLFDLISKKYC